MKNTFKVVVAATEYRFQFTKKQFNRLMNDDNFDSLYEDLRDEAEGINYGEDCFWITIPNDKHAKKVLSNIKAIFKGALNS